VTLAEFVERMKPYFKGTPRVPKAQPGAATPAPASAAPAATPTSSPAPGVESGELAKRRDELARELAELQWDLGGLTYEMAIRDHFRLDLLVRQAAKLQQVDAELGAVERLLRMGEAGAAGSCPKCGAFYARGAVYCWQCGTPLMQQTATASPASPPAAEAAPPAQPTTEHPTR